MSSADERIINRLQRIYDAQGAGGAAFSELTGEPTDNAALGSALSAKVPTSRTVNGQPLSGNVVVTGLMLDTTGAPDNGDGNDGDYAFDDATKTIYGPKAAGVWPAGVALAPSGGVVGTAQVVVVAGTSISLSHPFGVLASGITPTWVSAGVYTITKSTAFADDGRDFRVGVTPWGLAAPYTAMVEASGDTITISTFDVSASPVEVDRFMISVEKLSQ